MNCEICQKDIGMTLVLLPIRRPDGALNTQACLSCAQASAVYCQEHASPHAGYPDGTTACLHCVNQQVEMLRSAASDIYDWIQGDLDAGEFEDIRDAAHLIRVLLGDSEQMAILRLVVTTAVRKKQAHGAVIRQLLHEQSASVLLYVPGL